jgi:secondary thiamine-phosphate synthase enzyme
MNFYARDLRIRTKKKLEILDVTDEVQRIVEESRIKNGVVNLWVPHSTAAISVNERDADLWEDILAVLQNVAPVEGSYLHNAKYRWSIGEQNAHAHILSCLIQPGISIPLENGGMQLGTWQSILFIEMDGSRSRRIHVQVMGE